MSDSVAPLPFVVDGAGKVRRFGYAALQLSGVAVGDTVVTFNDWYVTSGRGDMMLFASGSGFRKAGAGGGFIGINYVLDVLPTNGEFQQRAIVFANEEASHRAFVTSTRIHSLANVPPGTGLDLRVFSLDLNTGLNADDILHFALVEFL